MILLISTCNEALHEREFVDPIATIGTVRHYNDVTQADIDAADKIIICGTSLKDNQFINDIEKFEWIKSCEKPILGICAGMQIIGMLYGAELKETLEIGFYTEEFKPFLGLDGEHQVYHLHQTYADFSLLKTFTIFAGEKVAQAVKHNERELYGVLFHPEVRHQVLLNEFMK
jgi:GMP synthase-like glutamine amidotransferase